MERLQANNLSTCIQGICFLSHSPYIYTSNSSLGPCGGKLQSFHMLYNPLGGPKLERNKNWIESRPSKTSSHSLVCESENLLPLGGKGEIFLLTVE